MSVADKDIININGDDDNIGYKVDIDENNMKVTT